MRRRSDNILKVMPQRISEHLNIRPNNAVIELINGSNSKLKIDLEEVEEFCRFVDSLILGGTVAWKRVENREKFLNHLPSAIAGKIRTELNITEIAGFTDEELNTPIINLINASPRLENGLSNAGVISLRDLLVLTPKQLCNIRNIGDTSLSELFLELEKRSVLRLAIGRHTRSFKNEDSKPLYLFVERIN